MEDHDPTDGEPLEEWAARREARRPPPGGRRAVPLDADDPHGEHINPDAPRGVVEWDGQQWTPAGVAADHKAAAQEIGPDDAARRAEAVDLPRFNALPPAPEPWRPTQVFRRP